MHTFARRTAGIIAAVAVVTLFTAGCDKDNKDSKSDATTTVVVTTTEQPVTGGETTGATETKIATRDGEIAVGGTVLAKYNEFKGEAGPLGAPTGPEQDTPGGGISQEFAGGAICSSPTTGTHVVWGEIRKAWDENGGPGGKLGYPTSDETDIPGGKQSEFTGGNITWVNGQTSVNEK